MVAISTIATFRIAKGIALVIARGSVLDFESKYNSAIVNAANEGCLGGGGVDGAISNAGGEALFRARRALPIIGETEYGGVRCRTGDAKITGPGKFGRIKTNHVIHAVAPDYNYFYEDEYGEADALLCSAYTRTLKAAEQAQLQDVGFSLLAAGIFRGKRSLKQILGLGVASICRWAEKQPDETSVKSIVMCAFLEVEARTLLEIAKDLGLELEGDICFDTAEHDAKDDTAKEDTKEMNVDTGEDDAKDDTAKEDGKEMSADATEDDATGNTTAKEDATEMHVDTGEDDAKDDTAKEDGKEMSPDATKDDAKGNTAKEDAKKMVLDCAEDGAMGNTAKAGAEEGAKEMGLDTAEHAALDNIAKEDAKATGLDTTKDDAKEYTAEDVKEMLLDATEKDAKETGLETKEND